MVSEGVTHSLDVEAQVWQLLDSVCDPEIPVVSLRELGVLRSVTANDAGADTWVEVVITPTYSGCPAMGQMEDDVKAALQAAGITATVRTVLAPAWTTDWMSDTARDKLKAYGIAPPGRVHVVGAASPGHAVIQFAPKLVAKNAYGYSGKADFNADVVACPRCESVNTTETSHFGSTACKAMYKCLDCLEPFDHFKPY